jgi:hypothetical protein
MGWMNQTTGRNKKRNTPRAQMTHLVLFWPIVIVATHLKPPKKHELKKHT